MNVVRLMGGLGNQMFQYAFGRAMMEFGTNVAFDISNFGKSKHREYMLGNFNVNISFSTFVNSQGCLDTGANPSFNTEYLKMKNRNYFGYWQYLRYFEHLLPKLRKELSLKEEAYTEDYIKYRDIIKADKDSVSVHVRRDDYVTSKSIPCLPFSYYYEALNHIDGNIYVFSDDIDWCKHHFVTDYFEREITFVNLEYYHDFELMRFCHSNVISNSTFSYWAAILNDSPEKKVVTPDFWVTRLDRMDRQNYPDDWIKIESCV